MNLKPVKFTEDLAKEVTNWNYEGEYFIYNLPSWDEIVKNNFSLCNEEKRKNFIAYVNDSNELVGFVNLLDECESVFFGIGVKPEYCGVGIGKKVMSMGLLECIKRHKNKPIVLEVRSWNKRAVKCYESQGFKVIETKQQETHLGFGEFFVMKYEV